MTWTLKNNPIFGKFLMVVIILCSVTTAEAFFGRSATGGIVFDPNNYLRNTMSALQQQMATANSYIQTAQDIRQTARKIGTLGAEAVGLSSEDGRAILKFIQSGKNLYGALKKTADIDDRMKRSFANSKYLTWESFVKGIGDRREQGDATAKSLYDSAQFANDQLAKAHEQHQKIVKDLPDIEGVTDAAVSTTQAVGVLIQQNQAILQMMSEQTRAQGQELQRQAMEREQNERALKEHHDNLKEALDKDKALIENMGKSK